MPAEDSPYDEASDAGDESPGRRRRHRPGRASDGSRGWKWRGEEKDPNVYGRGMPPDSPEIFARGAGCLAAIIVLVGSLVGAVFLPGARTALLIAGGVALAVMIGLRLTDEPGIAFGPSTYGERKDWTVRAHNDRDAAVCRRIRSYFKPEIYRSAVPPTFENVFDVRRPGGTGHVALTGFYDATVRDARGQAVAVGDTAQMYAWVDLPAALPGLVVNNVRVVPDFSTESVEFNARFTIGRARIAPSLQWDDAEMRRYVSDLINPRVIARLLDAFGGFPWFTYAGDAIGVQIPRRFPHLAELTIDVLLDLVPLIPDFAYERYADQTAREAAYR